MSPERRKGKERPIITEHTWEIVEVKVGETPYEVWRRAVEDFREFMKQLKGRPDEEVIVHPSECDHHRARARA